MKDNDHLSALSDEARDEWCKRFSSSIRLSAAQNTWQECRRRAEVLIEQEKKATLSEIDTLIDGYLSERQRLEAEISQLKESIEAERRKAFEAAWDEGFATATYKERHPLDPKESNSVIRSRDYRAYTEAAKEER